MKKRGSSANEENKSPAKKQKTEGGCGHKAPLSSVMTAKKTRASKTDFKPLYTKHREIVD
jgi:hypothetical protein